MLTLKGGLTWHLGKSAVNQEWEKMIPLATCQRADGCVGPHCSMRRRRPLLDTTMKGLCDLGSLLSFLSLSFCICIMREKCLDDMNENQSLDNKTAANYSSSWINSRLDSNALTVKGEEKNNQWAKHTHSSNRSLVSHLMPGPESACNKALKTGRKNS